MTTDKKIVGFCGGSFGKYSVGKTTAANVLVDHFNFYLCSITKFVEEAAKTLYKWDGEKDKNGFDILNKMCSRGRSINENYWLNMAISSIPKSTTNITFDDIWFLNEFNFIKENNGIVVGVRKKDSYPEPTFDFYPDYFTENNGTIDEFKKYTYDFFNSLYN